MDWAGVLIALATSLPPALLALAAVIAAVRAGRKVDDLHVVVNSRLSELLEASVGEATARGELKGRQAVLEEGV